MRADVYRGLPLIECPVCTSPSFSFVTERFDSGRIVRCSICRHLYLNPPLGNEQLAAIYSEYNVTENDGEWMRTLGGWFQDANGPYRATLRFLNAAESLRGKKVLEVGCGAGLFLEECRKRGAEVTGVDLSPHAVKLADRYFGLKVTPLPFEEAIRRGFLAKDAFDCIFLFEIIEHVRKPVEFLLQIKSLLAPGGKIFLSTPNFRLFYLMGRKAQVVNEWPEHLHFFDPSTLQNCVQRAGLEIAAMETCHAMSYADRKKQEAARTGWIRAVWSILRRSRFLYRLKDGFFKILDFVKKECGPESRLNGLTLWAVVRKPGL